MPKRREPIDLGSPIYKPDEDETDLDLTGSLEEDLPEIGDGKDDLIEKYSIVLKLMESMEPFIKDAKKGNGSNMPVETRNQILDIARLRTINQLKELFFETRLRQQIYDAITERLDPRTEGYQEQVQQIILNLSQGIDALKNKYPQETNPKEYFFLHNLKQIVDSLRHLE
ncbi:MAG: hypothetical protein ABH835_00480 [Patescibacteria group bacterium]|nr:hypothetical protein [Patescibacteria group bacterium]